MGSTNLVRGRSASPRREAEHVVATLHYQETCEVRQAIEAGMDPRDVRRQRAGQYAFMPDFWQQAMDITSAEIGEDLTGLRNKVLDRLDAFPDAAPDVEVWAGILYGVTMAVNVALGVTPQSSLGRVAGHSPRIPGRWGLPQAATAGFWNDAGVEPAEPNGGWPLVVTEAA